MPLGDSDGFCNKKGDDDINADAGTDDVVKNDDGGEGLSS